MQTITSDKSLIHWMQNRNGINYYPVDELFLKEDYANLFKKIADELKTPKASIVKLWIDSVEDAMKNVESTLCGRGFKSREQRDSIDRILHKFRGNCGEIFAEAFFSAGYMAKYCETGSYMPVDPSKERFIDATAVSSVDGLPIGIQIKNYKEFSLVPHEVFMKASAEDDLWLRHDKCIPEDKVLQFISSPHQYLFSFTDSREWLKENYFNSVVLIGPDEIDAAKLQGDAKNGIPGKARFFEKIAEEIVKLS